MVLKMNKPTITKKEVEKVVKITQSLEGYEPATKEIKEETKKLKEIYDIKDNGISAVKVEVSFNSK